MYLSLTRDGTIVRLILYETHFVLFNVSVLYLVNIVHSPKPILLYWTVRFEHHRWDAQFSALGLNLNSYPTKSISK